MLSLTLENVRLFLHVLAATVWVGGQIVLGGLVPALRRASEDAPKAAAVAFGRIAWPAFAILVATGVWNMAEESDKNHGAWTTTLNVKMALVVLSGVGAFLHTKASTAKARGIWAGVGSLSALLALLLGVQLAG
jgi:uncharacterized membrane protein